MQDQMIGSTGTDEQARKVRLVCSAAQLVLENGGETYRVEETAMRMAEGLGLEDAGIVAFPTSIFFSVGGQTRIRRINRRGVNNSRLTQVNDISRRVVRGELDADGAEAALKAVAADPGWNPLLMILAYGISAAGFSLLSGGTAGVLATAFVLGMIVQAVQPLFSKMTMGALFCNFTGGLITASLAQLLAGFLPYGDVNATITGGIMPLLTGLLMTTAVRDTMYGDLVSGVSRAVEALLLAGSVALGVFFGLSITSPAVAAASAAQMPLLQRLGVHGVGAFLGTLGYVFLLNTPFRAVVVSSLTAVAGYLVFLLLFWWAGVGEMSSYFLATVFVSMICEIEARMMRMPSTVFLISALVPLVPGYAFYCAMLSLVEDNGAAAAAYGMEAVQIVAVIAVGAAVTSVLFRSLSGVRIHKRSI